MDDIDRLDPKQIIDLFRALSAIVNYHNLIYVLAFDKIFVSKAIEQYLPTRQSGADYLEKIIQLPLNLPIVTQPAMDFAFKRKLDELFKEFSIETSEEEANRFNELYVMRGVNEYIKSPRDLNRVINALLFALSINKEKANAVDSVILEIIRLFNEPLYIKIRNNKEMLIGTWSLLEETDVKDDPSQSAQQYNRESFVEQSPTMNLKYYNDSEDDSKREQDLKDEFQKDYELIIELFPTLMTNIYTREKLHDAKRIASPQYFDAFFSSFNNRRVSVE